MGRGRTLSTGINKSNAYRAQCVPKTAVMKRVPSSRHGVRQLFVSWSIWSQRNLTQTWARIFRGELKAICDIPALVLWPCT